MIGTLRITLAFCMMFLLAVGAQAEKLENENVLAGLPDGFKVAASGRNSNVGQTEFIPADESMDDWTRMITVTITFGTTNADPGIASKRLADAFTQACPASTTSPVTTGIENGYPVSIWLYACDLNPATGKPEAFLSKYVGGRDSLYNVQYTFRSELTNEKVIEASKYLRAVMVCDTRLKDRPCPAGM